MSKQSGRLVYSTDQGKHCPGCQRPLKDCVCKDQSRAPSGDGFVRLQRQTKGRNGKPVVIITGLPLAGAELKKLSKELKARCGVGGTIEDNNILIQGDQREVIQALLEKKGFKVKLSGG